MNKYNQITVEERYHIYAYKKAGFCPTEMTQMTKPTNALSQILVQLSGAGHLAKLLIW